MIVNTWPLAFRNLYGGVWPTRYVAVDLETSGFDAQKDVILEFGWCEVVDCKIVDNRSFVLDWSGDPVIPDHWLRSRLSILEQKMRMAGKTCGVDYRVMTTEEGRRPARKGLATIHRMLREWRAEGFMFAAHSGYSFDEGMLAGNFAGFDIADGWSFGDNGLIDTDMIERASQAVDNPRFAVRNGDTLRSWCNRVKATRLNGVKSNLDQHCFTKYGWSGLVAPERMHRADADTLCVHFLMEEYRTLIRDDAPVTEPRRALPSPAPAPIGRRYRGIRNS